MWKMKSYRDKEIRILLILSDEKGHSQQEITELLGEERKSRGNLKQQFLDKLEKRTILEEDDLPLDLYGTGINKNDAPAPVPKNPIRG